MIPLAPRFFMPQFAPRLCLSELLLESSRKLRAMITLTHTTRAFDSVLPSGAHTAQN